MTRKKLGKELRKTTSIKIEPRIRLAIRNAYSSLTGFIDKKVVEDKKVQKELKKIDKQ